MSSICFHAAVQDEGRIARLPRGLAESLRAHLGDAPVFGGLDSRVSFDPWNKAHAEWPLARVECRTPEQVAMAVRVAADHGVPVSVCGGRQDVYGRNSRGGHLILDLRRMTDVALGADQQSVSAGGGVTTAHLLNSLPPDRVTPTVTNVNVGVVGAATGGGYGLLAGSYGLACDAVVGAELVLADGRVVRANARENPDLFWALRGGGAGFGVVTAMQFAMHRCAPVFHAQVAVPLSSATDALLMVQALLDDFPDALGLVPVFVKTGADAAALTVLFVWNGSEAGAKVALSRLSGIPGAEVSGGNAVPFRETLDNGAIWPWGKGWAFHSRTLERITPELARILVDLAADMPLPGGILFLHDFHGQAARVPPSETAFGLRRNHFLAAVAAPWALGEEEAAVSQQRWVKDCSAALARFALPGGYVNFLAPHEAGRAREFYGASAKRLADIKAKFDPHDVFQTAPGRLSYP